jgi:hypothetical protein
LNDSWVFDGMLRAWSAEAAASTTAGTSFDLGTLAQLNGGATSGAPSATALRQNVLARISAALRTPPPIQSRALDINTQLLN